jgi:hypothetical protein
LPEESAFRVLITLEAIDKATEIFKRMDEAMKRLGESFAKARSDVRQASADAGKAAQEMGSKVKAAAGDIEGSMSRAGQAVEQMGAKTSKASRDAGSAAKDAESGFRGLNPALLGVGVAGAAVALSVGMVGTKAVEMAGNFQYATERLVTGAGESQAKIEEVRAGILQMAGDVGVSADELAQGMYLVESAGFHASAGLQVMRAAAEGAKADGADMMTMADALTTALNAYGLGADHASAVTNQMVAAVAAGKMNMEDFASSLSAVLPQAAAAHLSFGQVAGAMATMTAQGMSARQAAQDLANTIRALQSPNQVAITEMQQLGISSNDVADNLGKRGLTGTLEMLTQAITSHMGPAGDVILSTFKNAEQAAKNVQIEIQAMPANLQKLANQFLQGSITGKEWAQALKALPPTQQHLMTQFASTADKLHEYNQQLTSGSPAAQTYTAALSKMMGGATGLNTALMLTGGHLQSFKANVNAVSEAGKKGGKDIEEWSKVQGEFNQRMSEAKASLNATEIAIGMALLPVAQKLLDTLTPLIQHIADWTAHHQRLVAILAIAVGALGGLLAVMVAFVMTMQLASAAIEAWQVASKLAAAATKIWTGIQMAFNLVMDANPIALVVIGIVALIAVIVLIITHWQQFTAIVQTVWSHLQQFAGWLAGGFVTAWHAVTEAVGDAMAWIGTHLHDAWTTIWNDIQHLVSTIGSWLHERWQQIVTDILAVVFPPGAGLFWLITHWQEVVQRIQELATQFFAWFKQRWQDLTSWITGLVQDFWTREIQGWQNLWATVTSWVGRLKDDVLGFWGNLVSGIESLGGRIANAVTGPFHQGLRDAVGVINGFIHALDNIPGIGGAIQKVIGSGISIPGLAQGGVVTRPTLAVIGEGGGPEYVIPAYGGGRAVQLWMQAGQALGMGGALLRQFGQGLTTPGVVGGQCLEWVEKVTGEYFPVPAAGDLLPWINSAVARAGEIFVISRATIPPYGHTGLVLGPASNGQVPVIDSNWGLDEVVREHSIAQSLISGFIDLGRGLPAGIHAVGSPIMALRNATSAIISNFEAQAQALGGLGAAFGYGVIKAAGDAINDLPKLGAGIVGDLIHALGFDQGGLLPPGLTLAWNGTGRPETVLPPGQGQGNVVINLNLQGAIIASEQQFRQMVMRVMNDYFVRSVLPRAGVTFNR